jgi:hypothetical protein
MVLSPGTPPIGKQQEQQNTRPLFSAATSNINVIYYFFYAASLQLWS